MLWFVNNDCQYCTDLDDEVQAFARHQGATLARLTVSVLDPDTGEAQVPALMFTHPKTRELCFVGRFCLDACRWVLQHDG